MATWYSIRAVPVGTLDWIAGQGAFYVTQDYERSVPYSELMRRERDGRWSGWVSDRTSVMELYWALTGQPPDPRRHLWFETGKPDPYRLALVGGDLVVPILSQSDFPVTSLRLSTAAEAAEAVAVMEGIWQRFESGEAALQPCAQDIKAYAAFYRTVRLGDEELIYART